MPKTTSFSTLWGLVIVALAVNGPNVGATDSVTTAKTSPSLSVPNFRSTSLERRCQSLAAFVQNFGREKLSDKISVLGCAESNGIGGPLYSVDFRSKMNASITFRLDVSLTLTGKARVRLCDTGTAPTLCTKSNTGAALVFEKAKDSDSLRNPLTTLENVHPDLKKILSVTYRWVMSKPWNRSIFGQPYNKFVDTFTDKPRILPVPTKGSIFPLSVVLKPTNPSDPTVGTVVFSTTKIDKDFMGCFGCTDEKCMKDINYTFQYRFVSFTRNAGTPEERGAGWIIESHEPMSDSGSQWKYFCGISRYSLQSVFGN